MFHSPSVLQGPTTFSFNTQRTRLQNAPCIVLSDISSEERHSVPETGSWSGGFLPVGSALRHSTPLQAVWSSFGSTHSRKLPMCSRYASVTCLTSWSVCGGWSACIRLVLTFIQA